MSCNIKRTWSLSNICPFFMFSGSDNIATVLHLTWELWTGSFSLTPYGHWATCVSLSGSVKGRDKSMRCHSFSWRAWTLLNIINLSCKFLTTILVFLFLCSSNVEVRFSPSSPFFHTRIFLTKRRCKFTITYISQVFKSNANLRNLLWFKTLIVEN